MREKFIRFMQGRDGADEFAKFTIGVSLFLIIVAAFLNRNSLAGGLFDSVGLLLMAYTYFRIFSRNISRRYVENQKYLQIKSDLKRRFLREKNIMNQRKVYHIYKCPGCAQKIRVPKGKGKIEISCPKCHTRFIKRS